MRSYGARVHKNGTPAINISPLNGAKNKTLPFHFIESAIGASLQSSVFGLIYAKLKVPKFKAQSTKLKAPSSKQKVPTSKYEVQKYKAQRPKSKDRHLENENLTSSSLVVILETRRKKNRETKVARLSSLDCRFNVTACSS